MATRIVYLRGCWKGDKGVWNRWRGECEGQVKMAASLKRNNNP